MDFLFKLQPQWSQKKKLTAEKKIQFLHLKNIRKWIMQ
jgi:hypothetical protein